MSRKSLLPLAWALACVAFVGVCAVAAWRGAPLQTDLLALLPATERNPTAERAVAALSEAAGNRAVFVVGHPDAEMARQAARRFAAALRASGAFRSVTAEVPPFDARLLGRLYADYRFGLLSDADRRLLASGKAEPESWLARRLMSPLRLDIAGDLALDPFGLLDSFVAGLPFRHLRFTSRDGLLIANDAEPSDPIRVRVLVTAELPGSAFEDWTQKNVVAAVQTAEQELTVAFGAVEVLKTGPVFYAAAARSAAAREMDLIGAGSVAGITLMLLAVFRSPQPLLLGLLTVGIGLAAATAVALLAYRELHLLTLVFGASLIGEAIDYPIQYFAAHAAAGRAWHPRQAVTALRPGLTFALVTSLMGYAALVWLPFPAIGQIALFAMTGLTAAYLTVLLLLPLLLRRAHRHDISDLTAPAGRFVGWWRERVGRGAALALACGIVLACAPGWLLLHGDDDVRAMSSRPPQLLAQESRIRQLTGIGYGSELFLVEARSHEALLQREEALVARLQELARRGEITHFHAVTSFVPSAARQADNRSLAARSLLADPGRLERMFGELGFRADAAPALTQAAKEATERTLTPAQWLVSPVAIPYRHLWLGETPNGYASIVLPFGHAGTEMLAGAAAGLDGVALVDKVGAVSDLVRDYRIGFSFGLAVAIAATMLVLSTRYGPSGAVAVTVPALLGIAVALGACGYAGIPVTLFTVMALMLVLGVGANYAIFLVEGAGREGMTFVAVLLSAATTLLSFGLLSFSGTPALARFGMTLTLGIGTAFLAAPLALSLRRKRSVPLAPGWKRD